MEQIKYRVDLYKLLPKNPVTVELGLAEGNFSEHILKHWGVKQHYGVDNYSPIGSVGDGSFEQEWHNANMKSMLAKAKPYKDKFTLLRGPTWHMAQHVKDNSVDLVYLDADHSHEGVMKDLYAWYKKVKPGGIVSGHDYINPAYGVLQAVNEFSIINNLKVFVINEDKDEDAGFYIIKPN